MKKISLYAGLEWMSKTFKALKPYNFAFYFLQTASFDRWLLSSLFCYCFASKMRKMSGHCIWICERNKCFPHFQMHLPNDFDPVLPIINMLGMAPKLERRKKPVFMANIFGAKNWLAGSKATGSGSPWHDQRAFILQGV